MDDEYFQIRNCYRFVLDASEKISSINAIKDGFIRMQLSQNLRWSQQYARKEIGSCTTKSISDSLSRSFMKY